MVENNNSCLSEIVWFGKKITLFDETKSNNILKAKSKIIWNEKILNSNDLGMITIEKLGKTNKFKIKFKIKHLRKLSF